MTAPVAELLKDIHYGACFPKGGKGEVYTQTGRDREEQGETGRDREAKCLRHGGHLNSLNCGMFQYRMEYQNSKSAPKNFKKTLKPIKFCLHNELF